MAMSQCPPQPDETDGRFDRAQLDLLYRIEAPRLIRYFKASGSHDDAHDLLQDAFLNLVQAKPAVTRENPGAYLQRIARNLLFNRWKYKKRWRALIDERAIEDYQQVSHWPEQGLHLEAKDMMQQYRRAVDTLPDKTREIFLLHRVDDLSYKEIAGRMHLSIKAIEYHIAAALKHINRALEQE
jgi:RNA polymerase sigma-70 factor (ECF subfamily)